MTTPASRELKECPFCRTLDVEGPYRAGRSPIYFVIVCGNPNCNAEVSDETSEGAECKWNTRAEDKGEAVAVGDVTSDGFPMLYGHKPLKPRTKLYTHPPRATSAEDVERMCEAFYENKGSMKWEKLLDCWKDNYRSNMRAALSAQRGE